MHILIRKATLFFILVAVVLLSFADGSAFGQSGNEFNITILDPQNRLGGEREIVRLNLVAALRQWAQYLRGVSTLDIEVRVPDQTVSGRFSGCSACAVETTFDGQKVLEEGAPYKMRTGTDTNGPSPDVIITVGQNALREYWIDPEPLTRITAVPMGKIDLCTVFAHELGHAFGINGRRDLATGQVRQGNLPSLFDAHMINLASPWPAFRGSATYALYGGDLPLTFFAEKSVDLSFVCKGRQYKAASSQSQNFYHYGSYRIPNESPYSLFGLMSGAWPYTSTTQGLRIPVGRLELAILKDLGVAMR